MSDDDRSCTSLTQLLSTMLTGASSRGDYDGLRVVLSSAAGALAADSIGAQTPTQRLALQTIVQALKMALPAAPVWRGHCSFLSNELLAGLRQEACLLRPQAIGASRHSYAPAGRAAEALAKSDSLTSFMAAIRPGCRPTGIASYVFYSSEADGIPLHLDTDMFAINVLVMLEHRHTQPPSHLLLYTDGPDPQRLYLEAGEVVVFDGGGVIHGRERLKPDEAISVLTIGFLPSTILHQGFA